MLKFALNILGWFGIFVGLMGILFRYFPPDEADPRISSAQALNLSVGVLAFGLIFLALAAIIARLDNLLAEPNE